MKITTQHYDKLKTEMDKVVNDDVKATYKANGLSKIRFAWDVLHAIVPIDFVCKDLYEYLDDSHINTAILRIVGKY